jgi:hypothetical protein
MKSFHCLALALVACSAPAAAERLQFDYRLSPPLQQVLDAGDKGMIDFNADDPKRLVDLIAVKGTSAKDWTEALEIISIPAPRKLSTARQWLAALQQQALARCPGTFTVLAEDANSVTYERHSPDCAAERSPQGLYRLVAGKRSWFQLAVLAKGELGTAERTQWLAVLGSAHIE